MSGGHFNYNGYIYHQVYEFADELEKEIQNNRKEKDSEYAPEFNDEILSYLKNQVTVIRKVALIMKEIDYLYSGDHGEDSFLEFIKKIENETR